MRVLYLINSFNYGGAENHVLDLANSMVKVGNDVFIMTREGQLINRLNKEVTVKSLNMSDLLIPFQVLSVCLFISRNRIEVIHAHKRLPILIASLAGKIMKVPVVATVHGQPRIDLRSCISRRFPQKIIFVSKRLLNQEGGYREVSGKALFIQNGVEIPQENVERDYNSISYISRIDKKHSFVIRMIINEVMPEIVKKYPMASFNIIGDGEFLELLRSEGSAINNRMGREVCIIHGYIPDVMPLIKKSGLVLGVGRAAIESLACAVPVLSVNRDFLGEFISRDNYRYFKVNNFVAAGQPPPESETLIKLLLSYFANQMVYQKEAGFLKESIRNDFSIEKITGDILEVYRQLAAH